MLIPQLETQRLILREFREEDLDGYAEMCGDPEVMRYIGEGKPLWGTSGRDDRNIWR